MKTREDIVDALDRLTSNQAQDLDSIINRLQAIAEKGKITYDGLKTLTTLIKELDAIREYFTIRIINSLKRGNEI